MAADSGLLTILILLDLKFIARVSISVLKDLMDQLLKKRVINEREKESIPALPRADKAEGLIDMVLRKGNPAFLKQLKGSNPQI
uniref:CARD domain-containing protein n=1 Tax=Seriola lalandi dorsalis TaxID=1841481 RepID=A0A3B4XWZ0_SERLL